MYRHESAIIPLNIGLGTGTFGNLIKEDISETLGNERSVLIKSPTESWFRLKGSSDNTVFIEGQLFGLNPGDKVTVEFEELSVGELSPMSFVLQGRDESYGDSGERITERASDSATFFTKKRMSIIVPTKKFGWWYNIRQTVDNRTNIVRNVKLIVETSNSDFSMVTNIVNLSTLSDYVELIEKVSSTRMNESMYYGDLRFLRLGGISTTGGATTFSGNSVYFKGAFSLFSPHGSYRVPSIVFAEVNSPTAFAATSKKHRIDGTIISTDVSVSFGGGGAFKKSKYYGVYYPHPDTYALTVDVGAVSSNTTIAIKNFYASTYHFGDKPPKHNPNSYELAFPVNSNSLFYSGYGAPEGVVAAPVGSIYTNLNGAGGTTLYVKEIGNNVSGWVGK